MQMSVEEIKRNYNEAKNKNRQIGILADLNCCSKEEIEKIVAVEDAIEQKVEKTSVSPVEKELSVNDVRNQLYERMDELDLQIKTLEKEYRNIVITLGVLAELKQMGEREDGETNCPHLLWM